MFSRALGVHKVFNLLILLEVFPQSDCISQKPAAGPGISSGTRLSFSNKVKLQPWSLIGKPGTVTCTLSLPFLGHFWWASRRSTACFLHALNLPKAKPVGVSPWFGLVWFCPVPKSHAKGEGAAGWTGGDIQAGGSSVWSTLSEISCCYPALFCKASLFH